MNKPIVPPLSPNETRVSTALAGGEIDAKRPEQIELDRKRELLARARINLLNTRDTRKVTGGKPGKQYVWVNSHSQRIAHFESLGYKVCKDPDVQSSWRGEDLGHKVGDLILMEVDKELYDAYKTNAAVSALDAVDNSREEFLNFAAQGGVPVQQVSR